MTHIQNEIGIKMKKVNVVDFYLHNTESFVTEKEVTLELIKDYLEIVHGDLYSLSLDADGLFSDLLSGNIEKGYHFTVKRALVM